MKKKFSMFIAILFFATVFGSNESFADEINGDNINSVNDDTIEQTESLADEVNGDKINSVTDDTIEQTESLEIQEDEIQPFSSSWRGDNWMGTMDTFDGNQMIHWSLRADPRVPFEFSGRIVLSVNGSPAKIINISGRSSDGSTISDIENLPRIGGSEWTAELTGTALALDGTLLFRIRADEFTHHIQ